MCWGTDADKVRLKCRNDSINGDKILWMHFLLFPKSEAYGHFFPPPKHKEMQFIILSQSNNLFCNMNRTMFFTSSILTLFFFCLIGKCHCDPSPNSNFFPWLEGKDWSNDIFYSKTLTSCISEAALTWLDVDEKKQQTKKTNKKRGKMTSETEGKKYK